MQAALAAVLQANDTWDNTYRILRPDGSVAWIQSLGRADRDAAGQVTTVTGLELDITQRRRAEEAFQARREEEHDRELRLLLETATQGIVSIDSHGTIVMANRALETMFGWPPGELIGEPITRLLRFALRDGHLQHGTSYFGVRKDTSAFPIEVTVNHVPTASGGRAIAFVTDITERLRAASALQERTEELEYRTTQLSRMAWELTLAEHHAREQIAKTLHDGLQQLLLIVGLNIEQALQQVRDAGAEPGERLLDAKHHLDEAIAAARSLHVEVFPPALQRSGLPAALTWLGNWAHEKYGLEVLIDTDPRADSERKDIRTLLFESARELLINAFKHARATRITLTLTLTSEGQLCILVSDDGVGFEPARLDDRSEDSQVGWGLFSIRERLTLLGGHVDIDSGPDQGTRVRLVAPRGAVRPTPEPAVHGALRILIVDDHPAIRNALRQVFQPRPQLSVVGDASNGIEAIARARALRPDVIIMDVSMPQMDGIEATARIHAELPGIHIVGLSMQARDHGGHPIEHAGAAAFFVKGVDAQPLIDHLLALHTARRGAPA
jgi:PAS domain S-box-containing protein